MSPSRLTAKVEAALTKAQKLCKTAFHFSVRPLTKDELGDCQGTMMVVCRTAREDSDPDHFILAFVPNVVAESSAKTLFKLAVHEIIHCTWWSLSQEAERGKEGTELKRVVDLCESATYKTQRMLVGDIDD